MLTLLAPIFLLGLLVAFVYFYIDRRNMLRHLIYTRLLFVVLVVLSTLFLVRYWLVNSIGCIPQCAGASLLGRDLKGKELNTANFVEADLSGADLSRTQLRGADLSGATLIHVNFESADLQGAILAGANLQSANLAGANLDNANLSGANLNQADLTGVDLSKTLLYGARLSNAQLVRVNLLGASLAAIDLSGSMLNGAQLTNVDLSGATLSHADLSGAQLNNSNLSGAWLNLTNLTGAELSHADLSGASLIAANLSSSNLSDSRLAGATLLGAILDGANLQAADLRGAKLTLLEVSEQELQLDPAVAELNELQRSQLLLDATFDGVSFNQQTVWPNPDIATTLATLATLADSNAELAVDTIKIGLLYSLSGELAANETPILDAAFLAIDEINAAGGVLGQPLEGIIEDGGSDPAIFAEKARKLLTEDKVAAIFGGWSSDSRRAILPVVEELNGLLFYPAVYEGFESSPNIFYVGAEPSQQIIPAVDYLLSQKHQNFLLLGSDDRLSHTANAIIKTYLAEIERNPVGELVTLTPTVIGEIYATPNQNDFNELFAQIKVAPPDIIVSTLIGESNAIFFRQLQEAGFTAQTLPVLNVKMAEEEVKVIVPELLAGQLVAGNYYQSTNTAENFSFVTAFKTIYGDTSVTSDSMEAGYLAVYLWRQMVEQAQSLAVDDLRAAAATDKIEFAAPEGLVRIDGKTQHLYKTARVGVIREDGVIEEVFSSPEPIKPDPFLTQYPWADQVVEALEKMNPPE